MLDAPSSRRAGSRHGVGGWRSPPSCSPLPAWQAGSSRGHQASASPGRRSPAAPPTMSPSSSPRRGRSSARTSAAAQERYQRVLEERPDHPEAVTYSAWLLFIGSAGANQELRAAAVATARDQLTRATELDPTYPDPHCFLGVIAANYDEDTGGGRNRVRPVPRPRSTCAGPSAGRAVRQRTGEHADDLNVRVEAVRRAAAPGGRWRSHRRRARGPRSCPSASRARRRCECRAGSVRPRPPASTSPCVQSTAPSLDSSSSCSVSSKRAPSASRSSVWIGRPTRSARGSNVSMQRTYGLDQRLVTPASTSRAAMASACLRPFSDMGRSKSSPSHGGGCQPWRGGRGTCSPHRACQRVRVSPVRPTWRAVRPRTSNAQATRRGSRRTPCAMVKPWPSTEALGELVRRPGRNRSSRTSRRRR